MTDKDKPLDLDELERVADVQGGNGWHVREYENYELDVRDGDEYLVCDSIDADMANYVATFDPPTVKRLIVRVQELDAALFSLSVTSGEENAKLRALLCTDDDENAVTCDTCHLIFPWDPETERPGSLCQWCFEKERIEDENTQLKARVAELETGNKALRELLWLRHGCSLASLYGDDGELQCNNAGCMIDFKRMTPEDIKKHWRTRGERIVAEHLKALEAAGETKGTE